MQNTPIFEENPPDQFKGIDIMRAVRSFDPCLPCGVHMYTGGGNVVEQLHTPVDAGQAVLSAGGEAVHELSITQSLVDLVAERTAGRSVVAVHVRVGPPLRGGARRDGVLLRRGHGRHAAGGRRASRSSESPAGSPAATCGAESPAEDLVLLCPCGSADVEIVAGQELTVTSVELEKGADMCLTCGCGEATCVSSVAAVPGTTTRTTTRTTTTTRTATSRPARDRDPACSSERLLAKNDDLAEHVRGWLAARAD